MSKFAVVILHGTDRCGGSAISRYIASSPNVCLWMQPFNSGPFREKAYKFLVEDDLTPREKALLESAATGHLNENEIKSNWFFKFSHKRDVSQASHPLYLIKTTINVYHIPLIKRCYPNVAHYGVWRDPTEIFKSFMANGMGSEWFSDGIKSIPYILSRITDSVVKSRLLKFHRVCVSPIDEVAVLLALQLYFMTKHIPRENFILFDEFRLSPQRACREFSNKYRLYVEPDVETDFLHEDKSMWVGSAPVIGESPTDIAWNVLGFAAGFLRV